MKGEYDDIEDNDQCQYVGLGAGKKNKMSREQQIYGDFYQAYQNETHATRKKNYSNNKNNNNNKSYGDAYDRFKSGSKIQNYAAQCDVHFPQPKLKKKVKLDQTQQQQQQQPQIGQFNLQSFLRDFQQKQQLQQINQEQDDDEYNGPLCLHSKVKKSLKLVKIGEQQELSDIDNQGEININEMTFEQYRKLVMRNGRKDQQPSRKKLSKQEKQKEKEFIQSYGKGYSMLQKMGFSLTKGLGKDQKGITKPVEAVFKTAFTTKDTQLKQQQSRQQQAQTQEQQIPAQTALFQHRSRNIKINNFLLDLKNKFESITSKMYFYQKQVQSFDRDFQINQSLKLQKQNCLQQHDEEIRKLSILKDYGRVRYEKIDHNQQLISMKIKHVYPHLALRYKMDLLFVKNQYLKLKAMSDNTLFDSFPDTIKHIHKFLNHFYLQKEKQTIKGYQDGIRNFKDKHTKVINLQEEVIDLVDERPTEPQSFVTVSVEDQLKITKIIDIIAENTLVAKVSQLFYTYQKIEDVKNFKVLECLRTLKELNKKSELVQNLVSQKIKPLVQIYYQNFDYHEVFTQKKQVKDAQKIQNYQLLPHLIIFPLFQIMDPTELQLGKLLKVLSKKLWNLKSSTLHNILKPILQYCPSHERQHFINFYLAPRLMYHLQEFDLTQPHICKQLMSNLKLYKQFLNHQILKDLLNCTILPEIVMTYRKYEAEGTSRQDLSQWTERWIKQIGKIVPNYLQEVLVNDFNIQL